MIIFTSVYRYRNLFKFTILNYIDKLLLFILPLLVLFISNDKQVYNDIEYIFSIANISVPVLSFISIYAFYGYKQSKERIRFTARIQGYFWVAILLYSLFGLLLYPFVKKISINSSMGILYIFICGRTLYLLFINFYNVYFRLIDKPSGIFLFSIPVSLFSLLFIYIVYLLQLNILIEAFFIPQMLIVTCGMLIFILKIQQYPFAGLKMYLKSAVKYATPIIINTLCVAFITNYGKIYAYHYLSEYEIYKFSYIMRISMIIHMAHTSIIAYYGKQIYTDTKNEVNKRIFVLYSLFIIGATLLSVFILYLFNLLPSFETIKFDISMFLILAYTILHCFISFFEMYFSKQDKNVYILLYSLISCTIYLFLLFFIGVKGVSSLSLYMVICMTINIILVLTKLKKIHA
jgi:hypothetical protein